MSGQLEPRDVIAQFLADDASFVSPWNQFLPTADRILTELRDAGFEVVERTDGPRAWRQAKGALKEMGPDVPTHEDELTHAVDAAVRFAMSTSVSMDEATKALDAIADRLNEQTKDEA